ncbi:MAG: PAS domain-containing protein [Thermoplasmatota archaeon]
MWWQRADDLDLLLEASWLQGPLRDPACVVTVQDTHGKFLFVGHQASDLLGYKPKELKGKRFEHLLLPVDLDATKPLLETGRQQLSHAVLRLRCATGEQWFHTTFMPVGEAIIAVQRIVSAPASGCPEPTTQRAVSIIATA